MTTKSENDPLKENFNQFFHLSDKSFSNLKSIFRYSHREKGEVFIRVGYRNESEYMILNGFCRSFLLNPEGEEITLSFFKQNSVLSPHITRTNLPLELSGPHRCRFGWIFGRRISESHDWKFRNKKFWEYDFGEWTDTENRKRNFICVAYCKGSIDTIQKWIWYFGKFNSTSCNSVLFRNNKCFV